MRIVRPSGVWNTRTPFHQFFQESLLLQRDYGLLTCTVARARYEIDHDPTHSPTRLMRPKGSGPVAGKAWIKYRGAWQALSGRYGETPDFSSLLNDLGVALYAIREAALIRYAGTFESFVQCWALNMILASLERQATLTRAQVELAEKFSPVGKDHVVLPGVPAILRAFPNALAELRAMPHISTDPVTGEEVEIPSSLELNSYRVVSFWRDVRNFIVHRGSRLSSGFVASHGDFFELLRRPYAGKLRPLTHGARIQVPDVVYYAMATTHNKAAGRLNFLLQEAAAQTRGRVYLSSEDKEEPVRFDQTVRTHPLLVPGDHAESLKWVEAFHQVPEEDEELPDDA